MPWIHFGNSLCLQVQAAASSAARCSAGAPSALSSGNLTRSKSSWLASATVCSQTSQSGTTCRPLTGAHGAASWTSSAAASRAKTSALRARGPGLTAPDPASGHTLRASFARWDRDTSSWRTAQCSLLGGLVEYSETWPRWGMMRAGVCSGLTTSALRINATACGSELRFPTPTVCGNYNRKGASKTSGDGLATVVRAASSNGDGGPLNPPWVEWLMGWPQGWTGLEPLEMDRYRSWLQQHGKFFPASKETA